MKNRWGVGGWGAVAILLAFALTGSSVLWIRRPLLALLLPEGVSGWVYWPVYIVTILPLYQVILLMWGALLGQFSFFWEKEKAIGRLLVRAVRPRRGGVTS